MTTGEGKRGPPRSDDDDDAPAPSRRRLREREKEATAMTTNRRPPSLSTCFVEVRPRDDGAPPTSDSLECYVLTDVEPCSVGPLMRGLNSLLPLRGSGDGANRTAADSGSGPRRRTTLLPCTDHLKRIRRRRRRRTLPQDLATPDGCVAADAANARLGTTGTATVESEPGIEETTGEGSGAARGKQVVDWGVSGGDRPELETATVATMTVTTSGDGERDGGKLDGDGRDDDGGADGSGGGALGDKKSRKKEKKKKLRQNGDAIDGNDGAPTPSSSPWSLDLLVGSVEAVDNALGTRGDGEGGGCSEGGVPRAVPSSPSPLTALLSSHGLSSGRMVRALLPGRPARDREELSEWNGDDEDDWGDGERSQPRRVARWPTLFFEKKTREYREAERALSEEEWGDAARGLAEAAKDAAAGRRQYEDFMREKRQERGEDEDRLKDSSDRRLQRMAGVVLMDPNRGGDVIVSRASDERVEQMRAAETGGEEDDVEVPHTSSASVISPHNRHYFPDDANPLCTSALLAIQGVSRCERERAAGRGMGSAEFKKGQYLCTGYDVYLTREPDAYEAMALVHSRARRVFFGVSDGVAGGLGGATRGTGRGGLHGHGGAVAGIHSLPGTNHRYRAFRCNFDAVGDAPDDCFGGDDDNWAPRELFASLLRLHPNE